MDGPTNGVFTAQLQLTTAEDVQVALMSYTFSDADTSQTEGTPNRRTPWKGSKYGEFGEAGFSFSPIQSHSITTSECSGTPPAVVDDTPPDPVVVVDTTPD